MREGGKSTREACPPSRWGEKVGFPGVSFSLVRTGDTSYLESTIRTRYSGFLSLKLRALQVVAARAEVVRR